MCNSAFIWGIEVKKLLKLSCLILLDFKIPFLSVNKFLLWQICYFFYKNLTYGLTIFLYEARTSFSATPAYNDWFLSLYNVLFTSIPVITLGVFDQDVSARLCLKVCLYRKSVDSL